MEAKQVKDLHYAPWRNLAKAWSTMALPPWVPSNLSEFSDMHAHYNGIKPTYL